MKLNKINQIRVKAVPAIACTSIALITSMFAQELIISNSSTHSKVESSGSKEMPKIDLAITTIENEILIPVREQELRSNLFSRAKPRSANTYDLVETSSDPAEGARYFDILVTTNDIKKHFIILNNVEATTNTAASSSVTIKPEIRKEPKVEPKTYLKIKYLTESNKVLIQQDNDWVEKSQHKFLKFLPVLETKK